MLPKEYVFLDIICVILIFIEGYLCVHLFINNEVILGIIWAGLTLAHIWMFIYNIKKSVEYCRKKKKNE